MRARIVRCLHQLWAVYSVWMASKNARVPVLLSHPFVGRGAGRNRHNCIEHTRDHTCVVVFQCDCVPDLPRGNTLPALHANGVTNPVKSTRNVYQSPPSPPKPTGTDMQWTQSRARCWHQQYATPAAVTRATRKRC